MRKKLLVIGILVLLLVLGTAVVYALTVAVDGDETGENEWGVDAQTCMIGSSGCSRVVDDGQDVYDQGDNPYPIYDIDDVHVTNDSSNFYMRLDFLGNGDDEANTFVYTAASRPILNVCIDIDASNTTGVMRNAGSCDGNESMTGVDYIFEFTADEFNPNIPTLRFIDCYDGSCAVISPAPFDYGYDADPDAILEIGISFANLNVTTPGACAGGSGTQPCSFRLGVFYDNGVEPTDDSVPDNGFTTGTFGGGSPTAVTLQSTSASTSTLLGLAAIFALTLVSAGALIYRRQTRVQ